MTAAAGTVVELRCRAKGSPNPTLNWKREDGKMGRVIVSEDGTSLRLVEVSASDSGIYVCEAENEAGVAVAKTTVNIVAAPEIVNKPQNQQVLKGDDHSFSCKIKSEQPILVLWRLPSLDFTAVLLSNQRRDRTYVTGNGDSLMIKGAQLEDSGTYTCWGISTGGSINSEAELTVVDALPPPLVGLGPIDQKVSVGSSITFPCDVTSESSPFSVSWWYKESEHMEVHQLSQSNRIQLPQNGALILKDVVINDSGVYTCRVTSGTGTVEVESFIEVVKDKGHGQITQPRLIPAPPAKPQVKAVSNSAILLNWQPNSRVESARHESYTVEYWRPSWSEWRVAEEHIMDESCTISNLIPGEVYIFAVRAVNKRGKSFPSPWSDMIRLKDKYLSGTTVQELNQAHRRLSRPAAILKSATATSSDSVMLSWELTSSNDSGVEGVLIYSVSMHGEIQATTALGSSSSSHTVRKLLPNTKYTFFLVPFWRSIEGTPSNSYQVTTPEDGKF